MTELLRRSSPDAIAKGDGRTLDVRLYTWGDIATRTNEGIREQLMPGVFGDVDPSRVTLVSQRHDGPLVGVGRSYEEREDGIYASFPVAQTPAGDELLALASSEPPVLRDASVEFLPIAHEEVDGVVQRTSAELRRVAIIERGAYPSAQVLAVRSETDMDPVETEATEPQVEAPVTRAGPDTSRLDAIEGDLAKLAATLAVPAGTVEPTGAGQVRHPGRLHRSRVSRGGRGRPDDARSCRAVYGQQRGRRAPGLAVRRQAHRGPGPPRHHCIRWAQPLPSTGMELDWPYLNSSNTLVGVQSSEFDESTTARVDIAKATEDILTYSGYSDISYQLLQRSSPSYREAYNRILLAAWAQITDAAFVTALEADATSAQVAGAMLGANKTLSTSAAADDIVDCTGHGFSNGDPIVFTALTGGTGVTAGKVYWVIAANLTADDFQFSAEPGGAAVNFTADITGGTVAPLTDTGAAFRGALAQASVTVETATAASWHRPSVHGRLPSAWPR